MTLSQKKEKPQQKKNSRYSETDWLALTGSSQGVRSCVRRSVSPESRKKGAGFKGRNWE